MKLINLIGDMTMATIASDTCQSPEKLIAQDLLKKLQQVLGTSEMTVEPIKLESMPNMASFFKEFESLFADSDTAPSSAASGASPASAASAASTLKKYFPELDASDASFDILLKTIRSNDPNVNSVNLTRYQIDDLRLARVAKALEQNTNIKSLVASSNNPKSQFGNGGAFALRKLLEKTKTLEVLYIARNNIDVEGAIELMEGILQNNSLRDISIKGNPFLDHEPTTKVFMQVVLSKPNLIKGSKKYFLEFLKESKDITPVKSASKEKLLETLIHDPKGFFQLYCCSCQKATGQYSKLGECYCVPELGRFMDIPDYRKIIEDAMVELFIQNFPNKNILLKLVSAGSGSMLQDAILIAKLFNAGFKHIEWTPVDLCFNNKKVLFDNDYDDIIAIYQFMKLMHDLNIRVVNGLMPNAINLTQDAAFQFLKETTRPLKNPMGTLSFSLMGSVEEYVHTLNVAPRKMPHGIVSIDLNESKIDELLKQAVKNGAFFFTLEKHSLTPAEGGQIDLVQIEIQRKANGLWHPVIAPDQFKVKVEQRTLHRSKHLRLLNKLSSAEPYVSGPLLFRDIHVCDAREVDIKAKSESAEALKAKNSVSGIKSCRRRRNSF